MFLTLRTRSSPPSAPAARSMTARAVSAFWPDTGRPTAMADTIAAIERRRTLHDMGAPEKTLRNFIDSKCRSLALRIDDTPRGGGAQTATNNSSLLGVPSVWYLA